MTTSEAALVSAWYGPTATNVKGIVPQVQWTGHILSASNLPIYDVELTFHRAGPEHLFEDGWNIRPA